MSTRQIDFVDMCRIGLGIAEITKDLAHVDVVHFLSALTGATYSASEVEIDTQS